jgi:pimeloyl-ACP methyl ester carboxylesterase
MLTRFVFLALLGCHSSQTSGGPACDGAKLPATPADLAARGPSPVGVRTVVSGDLTVEVWYPAKPGTERGAPTARYDLRASMPPAEAAKIPDADNAWLACECTRDLPVDDAHGPYPVVIFLHGAASFRAQSAFLATHWASRGFVVVAPELSGIGLSAALGGPSGFPLVVPAQVLDLVTRAPASDPLAFIRTRLAPRVALVGHSLGSQLAKGVLDRPEVMVRIAMAGAAGDPDDGSSLLVLVGDHDGIAPADRAHEGFAQLARKAPARLAVVRGAGHLAFSDLCLLGADRGGSLAIARAHGVAVPDIVATLAMDGCRPTDAPFAKTAPAIRALTAGALEERLRCDARATASLAALPKTYDLELVDKR